MSDKVVGQLLCSLPFSIHPLLPSSFIHFPSTRLYTACIKISFNIKCVDLQHLTTKNPPTHSHNQEGRQDQVILTRQPNSRGYQLQRPARQPNSKSYWLQRPTRRASFKGYQLQRPSTRQPSSKSFWLQRPPTKQPSSKSYWHPRHACILLRIMFQANV